MTEPKYVRLSAAIRQRLINEGLTPGEPIPPERVLVAEFGVSRVTLRKAIDLLVKDDLLVRRHGIGTFVASPRVTYPLVGLHSTREIARAYGLDLEIRIVEYGLRKPTAQERKKLGLHRGEGVLDFLRRDLVLSEPVSFARCRLPEGFAPALERRALEQSSTYDLIEAAHSLRLTHGHQTMRAEPASPDAARLLDIAPHAPVFVIDRVTFDASGSPTEWGIISYRHDRIELAIELVRESGGRQETPRTLVMHYP